MEPAAFYAFGRVVGECLMLVRYDTDDQATSVEIPVRLAGREYTLRFVGTHWFDLKTILSWNDGV